MKYGRGRLHTNRKLPPEGLLLVSSHALHDRHPRALLPNLQSAGQQDWRSALWGRGKTTPLRGVVELGVRVLEQREHEDALPVGRAALRDALDPGRELATDVARTSPLGQDVVTRTSPLGQDVANVGQSAVGRPRRGDLAPLDLRHEGRLRHGLHAHRVHLRTPLVTAGS